MATFTATEVNPLKGVHVGTNFVRSRYTGSLTVSEVLLLARIPNKATVIDWVISGGNVGAASTGTFKIGAQGTVVDSVRGFTITEDSLHAGVSITASGAARGTTLLPFRISLSDDAVNQFVWLTAMYSAGSFTGSHSINFGVEYVMGE